MSFRLRVALLFASLVVLVVVAFGATLFVGQSRQTHALIEAGVGRSARHLAEGGDPWRRDRGFPGPALRPPANYGQLRDATGAVIERTSSLGDAELPLTGEGLAAVLGGGHWSEVATVADERLLVFSAPVRGPGGVVGVAQVAGSLTLADQYIGRLRTSLLLITLATIAVAFAGGWFVAGAVLEPVERITRTAHEIGIERDFGRRVEHAGPDDELGRLSHTFNNMLDALEAAYVGLEDALKSQRRFVADASHELRTPLTTIRGNAELLMMDPPVSAVDREAAVRDVISESDRMIALTNELLALARADAGRQPAREPVPLRPLMQDLRRQLDQVASERAFSMDEPPDVEVVGDRDALRQVLLNLVENAAKHTPPGATICVFARVSSADTVAIGVQDTGTGIDREHLPHVFERFHRGDESRTSPGTGLGLAIVKSLVESMGGTIDVASEVGVGTTFTVRLQRRARERAGHEVERTPTP